MTELHLFWTDSGDTEFFDLLDSDEFPFIPRKGDEFFFRHSDMEYNPICDLVVSVDTVLIVSGDEPHVELHVSLVERHSLDGKLVKVVETEEEEDEEEDEEEEEHEEQEVIQVTGNVELDRKLFDTSLLQAALEEERKKEERLGGTGVTRVRM